MNTRKENLRTAMFALALVSTTAVPAPETVSPDTTTATSDAGSYALEEVTVTAQRRSEKAQNVAISIAALSADELKASGVTLSTDVAKFTPGVTTSGTLGGQGLQFSIRGVTQADYNDAIEAPVAVYIDDTYVSSQQAQGMALFDISRVEALKGPQGTLFGRNATGGLVHFIVNTPKLDTTEAFANLTYGSFDKIVLESAVNVPLSSALALRVSGIWDRNDSIWKNKNPRGVVAGAPLNFGPAGVSPAGQDVGDQDNLGGRLQLLWHAAEHTNVRFTASAFRQNLSESPWTSSAVAPVLDSQDRVVGGIKASAGETRGAVGPGGSNYFNPAVLAFQGFMFSPNGNGQRAPGANWFGYVPLDPDDLELSKDFARRDLNRFRAYNAGLHIDSQFASADLASVTSYSEYAKHFLLDADGSPVNAFTFGTRSVTHTFTQELRLSSANDTFSWVTGAFYLDISAPVSQGLLAPRGSALALVFGMPTTGVDPVSVFDLQTQSVSLFGQTSWEFVPRWTLVTGARVIREKQQYDYASYASVNRSDYSVDDGAPLFPLYPSFSDNRSAWLWAAKAQLEFRPTDDLLVYGGVNRGVKAGSYNGKLFDGSPPLTPSSIPYEPEVLVSYEGGFKFTAPSFTFNGAVYHYQYSDYQSFVFTDISGYVQNRDAVTNGAELETQLQLSRDLRVGASVAYNDAKVEDLEIAPGVSRDTRPTYSPKWSAAGRLNYAVPISVFNGDLALGAIVTYQSSTYHNARNFESQLVDSRTLLDLTTAWSLANGFSVSAYVNNVFDKRYQTVGLDLATACGCSLDAYGTPRTAGVTLGYKF